MLQELSARKGETVTRILAAAKEVFAEVGFAGARVDEIARRADVNKASLYYHIGDKKALYAEVLHNVVGATAQKLSEDIAHVSDPEDKLRTYIRSFTAAINRNPQMPRIMMREIASGGENLPEVFFDDLAVIIATVTGILAEGVKTGVFVETNPVLIHIMIMGALIILKVSAPILLTHPEIMRAIKHVDRKLLAHVDAQIERLILRSVQR